MGELESAVGTGVTTDYGTAKVEKVEEIGGEMFLVIKYEDGAEENIKYEELDDIKVSPKKSSSTKKSTSTKKEPKSASPKASPSPTKKIAKSPSPKPVTVKKPAKKTVVKKASVAKVVAKKITVKKPAKKTKK